MTAKEIKEALFKICTEKVENRYQKIKQVLEDIKEALLEESKSTAGDKHETGRAMLDIDRENTSKQLQEIEVLMALLKKIDITTKSDYVRLGSLVKTDKATYFISLSIGSVDVNKKPYLCVALNSPMGQVLLGKKKGDTFSFNNVDYQILAVS
jgi:transcription elongation GreA/GreB family factor